jgi:hypothetical protein
MKWMLAALSEIGSGQAPLITLLAFGHDYRSPGLATVALPASVKRSFSSASRALARSIDSSVVSIQPAHQSAPCPKPIAQAPAQDSLALACTKR